MGLFSIKNPKRETVNRNAYQEEANNQPVIKTVYQEEPVKTEPIVRNTYQEEQVKKETQQEDIFSAPEIKPINEEVP